MTMGQWEQAVPEVVRADVLWRATAYRRGMFLSDLAWQDVTKLMKDRRTVGLSDQLFRAAGSISANIAEGYSRSTGKDRARFYEYALGSARETRDWYYKARFILGATVVSHRLDVLGDVIRLLVTMVPDQRRAKGRLSSGDGSL